MAEPPSDVAITASVAAQNPTLSDIAIAAPLAEQRPTLPDDAITASVAAQNSTLSDIAIAAPVADQGPPLSDDAIAAADAAQSSTPVMDPGVAIEADESFSDEGYEESTTTSYVTSIASDIRRGIEENGRIYAAYGSHECGMPVDDAEQDRLDFQHHKFTLLLGGRLHLSPISPSPQKILDLGTGSGIWAIDMADIHASASVIGVDIAVTTPQWLPPNLQFEIEDVENDWLWPMDSFDLIHGRELIFAIRDWPRLIRQSHQRLKSGGYLELSSTLPLVSCDDGTLPPNTAYKQLEGVFFDIGIAMNARADAPLLWKQQMEAEGFVDVKENVFKIPSNPWPKDKRLKEIGALEYLHFRDSIDSYFLRGCVQYLHMDRVQLEVLLAHAKREIQSRKVHSYVLFYNVTGRKP